MLRTFVTHEAIINEERTLQKWLASDQLDFDQEIKNAYPDMINDLRHRKDLNLRLLNIPLTLETDADHTAAADGTVSSEDFINRSRILIEVALVDIDAVFNLLGSDDSEADIGDWLAVTAEQIFIDKTGNHIVEYYNYYKYYRLQKTSTTQIQYSASLYETVYDFLHVYKTVERIYRQLNKLNDDAFSMKQELYKDKYEQLLINGRFYYDRDESGDYDLDERNTDVNVIRIGTNETPPRHVGRYFR